MRVPFLLAMALGSLQCFCFSEPNATAEEIQIREGWVLSAERGRARRIPFPTNSLEWASINDQLAPPDREADESSSAGGLRPWRKIVADVNGVFSDRELMRGWLWSYVDVQEDGVWLLSTRGSGTVWVNGEPRVGDIYGNSNVVLPIRLKAGINDLVLVGARGGVSAQLERPKKDIFLSLRDTTFPQIVLGESKDLWGSLMVLNASIEPQATLALRTSGAGLKTTVTSFSPLQETSLRKVGFRVAFAPNAGFVSPDGAPQTKQAILVELIRLNTPHSPSVPEVIDSIEVTWDVVSPTSRHRRTFISGIDGSVQYYSVVPASQVPSSDTNGQPSSNEQSSTLASQSDELPGLVLSLHGAGVEGEGQAAVYSRKDDLTIVAPTNRRNFGFDWEDWGRWDALEVLEDARILFPTDTRKTYLTGHSMGGHGTWHIGTLFPDRFAAIGPSAGWISFSTYVGGISPEENDDAVLKMLNRAAAASDTLSRVENLKSLGVYILHGDRDDNVPVEQARQMRSVLAGFHPDFVYKEQPGAGHWWGNACVDWAPMLTFFREHRLPESKDVSIVDFMTPSPVVSSRFHWCELLAQQQQGIITKLKITRDDGGKIVSGTTDNALYLAMDLWSASLDKAEPQSWNFQIDGSSLSAEVTELIPTVYLRRGEGGWKLAEPPSLFEKTPKRGGRFKEAFRNQFLLVYGSRGTPEENRWMSARAKYDAETFWYRGNGSVDVVSDQEWELYAGTDRNVIVYGNQEINAAWEKLLHDSPVNCGGGSCKIGEATLSDGSLAILMIRPRANSLTSSVGAIGGTDLRAMQSTDRLPLFSSGSGYPDVTVLDADYLIRGTEAVRVTGYFGSDWSMTRGDWASRGD